MQFHCMISGAKLQQMNWYLRSLGDHDTHRGWLGDDGSVLALCGVSFIPKPTVRQVGQRLVDGFPDLGSPPVACRSPREWRETRSLSCTLW